MRAMYLNVCAIVSDPNFKFLPIDEQHMWLKNKREMKKQLTEDIADEVADAVKDALQSATSSNNFSYAN